MPSTEGAALCPAAAGLCYTLLTGSSYRSAVMTSAWFAVWPGVIASGLAFCMEKKPS